MTGTSGISYAPYELKFRGVTGFASRRGALLCIDGGFADLHPWPELGDLSLEEELEAIKAGNPTPLGHKSQQFALLDRIARLEGKNLLQGLQHPSNHLHMGRWNRNKDFGELRKQVESGGFHRLKVKFTDFFDPREFREFRRLVEFTQGFEDLKIRLDFNYSFGDRAIDFEDLFCTFNENELDQIDFIEDPFLFEDHSWIRMQERFGFRFALDRGDIEIKTEDDTREDKGTPPFALVVIKPALEETNAIVESASRNMRRVVFTSYLDHPVGQMCAAYEASKHFTSHPLLLEDCGLLSHVAFEDSDFSTALQVQGSRLLGAEGSGWGFDELLARQDWKKL